METSTRVHLESLTLNWFLFCFFPSQSQEVGAHHQGALPGRDVRSGGSHGAAGVLRLWKVCFSLRDHLNNSISEIMKPERLRAALL